MGSRILKIAFIVYKNFQYSRFYINPGWWVFFGQSYERQHKGHIKIVAFHTLAHSIQYIHKPLSKEN